MRFMSKTWLFSVLMLGMTAGSSMMPAHADNWRSQWDNYRSRYDHSVSYKTRKVIKGGLIGAGVGAGAGLLTHQGIGRDAILGAGLGAGTQALRYSSIARRHPIAKTAAYGGLIGAGAGRLLPEGSAGSGALWGAAIGTGVGAFQHRHDF